MLQLGFNFDGEQNAYDRFKKFHLANPLVFKLFEQFSDSISGRYQELSDRGIRREGRSRLGARNVYEQIRWTVFFQTTGLDYKLNDHYIPFYTRLLIMKRPEYIDLFELRESRADVTLEQMRRELLPEGKQ